MNTEAFLKCNSMVKKTEWSGNDQGFNRTRAVCGLAPLDVEVTRKEQNQGK